MSIKFTIPVQVRNPLNGSQGASRIGMIIRSKERARLRNAAKLCTLARHSGSIQVLGPMCTRTAGPLRIQLTRVAPRALDGHDGLQAALKPLVDGIADALGVKDNDPRLVWLPPAQRNGGVREHLVEVVIE